MHCSSEAESSGIRGPSLQPDVFFVRVCKRSQSNRNHGSCFSSSTAVELSRPNAYQLLTPCQDSYKGQAACAWLCSWWRSEGMRKQNHPAFFVTHTIYFFFFLFQSPFSAPWVLPSSFFAVPAALSYRAASRWESSAPRSNPGRYFQRTFLSFPSHSPPSRPQLKAPSAGPAASPHGCSVLRGPHGPGPSLRCAVRGRSAVPCRAALPSPAQALRRANAASSASRLQSLRGGGRTLERGCCRRSHSCCKGLPFRRPLPEQNF